MNEPAERARLKSLHHCFLRTYIMIAILITLNFFLRLPVLSLSPRFRFPSHVGPPSYSNPIVGASVCKHRVPRPMQRLQGKLKQRTFDLRQYRSGELLDSFFLFFVFFVFFVSLPPKETYLTRRAQTTSGEPWSRGRGPRGLMDAHARALAHRREISLFLLWE